jgi:hypothetical protein
MAVKAEDNEMRLRLKFLWKTSTSFHPQLSLEGLPPSFGEQGIRLVAAEWIGVSEE